MLRQYRPHRYRLSDFVITPRQYREHFGTMQPGLVFHLEDHGKCILRAWKPREYTASRRVNGKWINTYMTGGHLAIIERLRDRREITIADHWIEAAVDA
jgi:hypothetical protein